MWRATGLLTSTIVWFSVYSSVGAGASSSCCFVIWYSTKIIMLEILDSGGVSFFLPKTRWSLIDINTTRTSYNKTTASEWKVKKMKKMEWYFYQQHSFFLFLLYIEARAWPNRFLATTTILRLLSNYHLYYYYYY